ncbi:hypothetical protein [Streptomyces nojiriensis]|uniref:hypothetical protein n=1 Tax=Streptomyces nojiriensis TaxID=66374 RepID=UPI0036466B62
MSSSATKSDIGLIAVFVVVVGSSISRPISVAAAVSAPPNSRCVLTAGTHVVGQPAVPRYPAESPDDSDEASSSLIEAP